MKFIRLLLLTLKVIGSYLLIFAMIFTMQPFLGKWSNHLSMVLCVVIMYGVWERANKWPLGLKDRRWFVKSSQGFALGAAMILICFIAVWLLGGVTITNFQVPHGGAWLDLGAVIVFWLVVAIGEEFFFRGYLQGLIKQSTGPKLSLIIQAVLFSLIHLFNPGATSHIIPLLDVLFSAFLLGWLREWTESIWLSVGFHWSWNFIQGNILGYPVSGGEVTYSFLRTSVSGPAWLSGDHFGLEGSIVSLICTTLVLCWIYLKTSRTSKISKSDASSTLNDIV
ncbi:CPBP family intramembrane glutamic endopeptidase [Brevibacillus ginsengisoli]|uniref:CPBP family intramembrane glutamic endopeptidase n=1 Tax=Brevibacillus ginsengisoli TaxID=363854 RepID=UPI003CF77D79